jgi:hypothetical protein
MRPAKSAVFLIALAVLIMLPARASAGPGAAPDRPQPPDPPAVVPAPPGKPLPTPQAPAKCMPQACAPAHQVVYYQQPYYYQQPCHQEIYCYPQQRRHCFLAGLFSHCRFFGGGCH